MIRVLLAEDQASVAAPVVSSLTDAGHAVSWVREMRELRRLMDDDPPDLLLLDTTLDTDGLEYFQALPDSTPVRVVSILPKPLDGDAVVAVVGDLLSMI